ncbi:hypothetical protein NHQ30_009343 [Ciborinia camelliae]|nr:hypothetical protein NHQ30_009343 [Ciborinia camelliae]
MAEAEQVDVPSATLPQIPSLQESQTTSLPQRDSSPRLDDHRTLPNGDTSQQVPEIVSRDNSAPGHSDDEVEFVFSVPRRRKKRRRRLEVPSQDTHIDSASPIPSAEISVTQPLQDKSIADMVPSLAPGIEQDMNMARSRSIHALHHPTAFESFQQPLNVLQSDLSESSQSHVSQTIPFKIPPPWYGKSMPPPPSPTSPYYFAKSTMFTLPEQDHAKKRKHEEDSHEYSNCVSPYKLSSTSMSQSRPQALPSHSEFSPISGHTGFVDFLEDPNVPTTFGGVPPPLPPHRPIIPGWQEFSWKPSDNLPPRRPPSVDSRTKISLDVNNDPEWHRKYHYVAGDSRLNSQQVLVRNSQSERFAQETVSPKSIPHEIQTILAPYSLVQKLPISESSPILSKPPASATAINPGQSSLMVSSKPPAYAQPTAQVVAARNTSPSPPPRSHVTAADMRRRPSLYKIPEWPHLREDDHASSSATLGECRHNTRDAERNIPRPLHSNTPHQVKAATFHTSTATSSSLQSPVPLTAKQQAPAPKHSPNLIIDIAQTSQETFPFAAVAARHNKPIQKVFDTFSAIIQLPLLKQAADGRRHGPLGSERMRHYREAKRAMERANREKEKGKSVRRGGE